MVSPVGAGDLRLWLSLLLRLLRVKGIPVRRMGGSGGVGSRGRGYGGKGIRDGDGEGEEVRMLVLVGRLPLVLRLGLSLIRN